MACPEFLAVLRRLEETVPLTGLERFDKRQAHFRQAGESFTEWRFRYQHIAPRANALSLAAGVSDTENSLAFQSLLLDQLLDDWFAWAHPPPPHTATRIKIILRKSKRLDLRARFIAAYYRQFPMTAPPVE